MMKVQLVDYYALAHRSYYRQGGRLSSANGIPTTILYTSIRTLHAEQKANGYDLTIVVKDPPSGSGKNNRLKIDPNYKANRAQSKNKEGFVEDSTNLIKLLTMIGMKPYEAEGFEADDLIATLATDLALAGHDVNILSVDTDFCQILSNKISLRRMAPSKIVTFGPLEAMEKFGVSELALVAEYKALAGDSCDNIPGIPGIGHKTAVKLLAKYGTCFNNDPKLESYHDQLVSSYQLAKIRLDCPYTLATEMCFRPDLEAAIRFVESLECKSLIKPLTSLCIS